MRVIVAVIVGNVGGVVVDRTDRDLASTLTDKRNEPT